MNEIDCKCSAMFEKKKEIKKKDRKIRNEREEKRMKKKHTYTKRGYSKGKSCMH